MTKQLHILLTLLLAMIFTSGGAQTVVFNETFSKCTDAGGNDGKWSGSLSASSITDASDPYTDNSGWKFNGSCYTANNCVKIGATKSAGYANTPSISLTGNGTLTFKAGAWNGKTEKTTLQISATNAKLDKEYVTLTKGAFTDYTVKITNATGNVTIKFTGKESKYNRFFLDEVKITQSGSDTPSLQPAELSFSATSVTTKLGATFTAPTLSNPHNLNVTYTSSDATVATVAADGSVSPLKAGTTTITAKSEATDTYDAGEASYILNVTPSLDDAISVAEALKTADGTKVLVKGIVTRTNAYNSKYTDLIYYVADAAADNELEVYKGKGLKGADITSADDIARGDEVYVYGTLTTYNKTTKEFAASSIILKQTKAEEKTSITAAGWATYVTARSVDFSKTSDVKAYTVAYSATDDAITLTPVTAVPGNTAVVLKGNQGDYTFTTTTEATAVSKNDLKFYTKATSVDKAKTVYILANNNGTVGFCPATVGSTVPAYKGYLSISGGTSAKNFFALDGTATGINSIAADKANSRDVRFNLAGQRVDKNYKGVVIVNGKKQLVK